jgi:hypothetical protein
LDANGYLHRFIDLSFKLTIDRIQNTPYLKNLYSRFDILQQRSDILEVLEGIINNQRFSLRKIQKCLLEINLIASLVEPKKNFSKEFGLIAILISVKYGAEPQKLNHS